MLLRLTITLAQVKADKTSENLLNEIRQIIYSLYRAKEITKNVYNNMDTISINSKQSKTSKPYRLLINITDKIDLRGKDKYIVLSNLSSYYTKKNTKESYKENKFKISAPT